MFIFHCWSLFPALRSLVIAYRVRKTWEKARDCSKSQHRVVSDYTCEKGVNGTTIHRNCRINSFDIIPHSNAVKSVRISSSSYKLPIKVWWTSSGPSPIECITFLFLEERRKRKQVCDRGVERLGVYTFYKLIEVLNSPYSHYNHHMQLNIPLQFSLFRGLLLVSHFSSSSLTLHLRANIPLCH